jgi:hypothetical protein
VSEDEGKRIMRKIHQVAVVAAAVGSLASIGAAGAAAAPVPNGQGNGQQGYGQSAPTQQQSPQYQQAPQQYQQQSPQYQQAPQQYQQPQYQQAPQYQRQSPQYQQAPQQYQQPQYRQAPQQRPQQQARAIQPLVQGGSEGLQPRQVVYGQAPQLQASPMQASSPTYNVNRPAQECSPQAILDLALPIGVLSPAHTQGFSCGQYNPAFNPR